VTEMDVPSGPELGESAMLKELTAKAALVTIVLPEMIWTKYNPCGTSGITKDVEIAPEPSVDTKLFVKLG
jgi:hypothetical protein